MHKTMKFFLSSFSYLIMSALILTSCSTQRNSTIDQTRQNIDTLEDMNLKKIANENFKNQDTVLVLLPLSGSHAQLGKGILNACILAAKESHNSHINFTVIDTANRSLDKNQLAWNYKGKHLKAIIGPIFFTEARRFGALFPNVPMFTFSNNIKINSNHIFACGLSPQDEINEIFRYSRKNKVQDFVILLPKGNYGDEIEQYLRHSMKKYNFDEDEDAELIRYSGISREEATKFVKDSGREAVFILDPILNLEELPSGTKVFTLSSHALKDQDAWQGCIFAFSNIQEFMNFCEKYRQIFGAAPSILDIIGYDITNAIYESAANSDEPFVFKNKNFDGCLGTFTITKNKGVKRRLSLYKGE